MTALITPGPAQRRRQRHNAKAAEFFLAHWAGVVGTRRPQHHLERDQEDNGPARDREVPDAYTEQVEHFTADRERY